ncbi:MAG TPA: enoyl-[acyl-carrier-protein] reductase FabL [Actinomycetota bacterium]|nr:enoyl-[acyl-carrier-protein] reductase FabL [Actinomycetota bacterium]
MRFEGRVALVTGGSRGIGRAVALRLAREGADIAVGFFRNREAAEKTVAEIEEIGRRAVAVRGHVGDADKVIEIVGAAVAELGSPDIMISNAASGVLRPLADMDVKGWQWTMDVNARALMLLSQATRDGMRASGGGAIVAVSSLGSERVLPAYGAVGASKAALESIVRYLAVEGAPDGIRVNAVSAGVVDTDALRHFPDRDGMLGAAAARTPAGRTVTPDDVAAAVSFLCSDDAWMVRGETLRVDGGYALIA